MGKWMSQYFWLKGKKSVLILFREKIFKFENVVISIEADIFSIASHISTTHIHYVDPCSFGWPGAGKNANV